MLRQILFQIHWFLGITAGLVLAVMGLTGATMSFEDEIMGALTARIYEQPAGSVTPLPPDRLIARISEQRPHARIQRLIIGAEPTLPYQVRIQGEGGREDSLVDPGTGELLGHRPGAPFFETVRRVHRFLALPGNGNGWGRQITGVAALSLIFFALSGLYLRWPRRPLDWRNWFVLDLSRTGRNLYRTLHAVIGGWVFILYLVSALSGLWWSYDWYQDGVRYLLTGERPEAERAAPADGGKPRPPVSIDAAWASLQRTVGPDYAAVTVTPPAPGKPVRFAVLPKGARHDRMTDTYDIDPKTGAVKKRDLYAERPTGKVLAASMLPIHKGSFFGLPGRIALLLSSLTMPLFTVTGLLLYLGRRRRKAETRRVMAETETTGTTATVDGRLLVAYASQTGTAERIARRTAAAFTDTPALLKPLSAVTDADLSQAERALFVVASYGEGEPPDAARSFARRMAKTPPGGMPDYAVLALGDREYPDFCAFGHAVDRWAHAGGGRRLFDIVEMDGEDVDAQRQWQQQITHIGADPDLPDWAPAPFFPWILAERRCLNPGSQGAPAFHLSLKPADGILPNWRAGDIAEISPRHSSDRIAAFLATYGLNGATIVDGHPVADWLARSILPEGATNDPVEDMVRALLPLPHREYSIASAPEDGVIDLLVRQITRQDGNLGLGSGWLTAGADLDSEVQVRIRENMGFRAPDAAIPILIGAGTGLAGLRAHLHARTHNGLTGAWLLFGERSLAHDAFHDAELKGWLENGVLERLDRAWSRDAGAVRYVQHLIEAAATDIVAKVDDGAVLFVCGSLEGMAAEVDAALRRILGDDRLEELTEAGRYRRDIY
jgi:sulfite reductase (NADPH) flavoprotein alpha-component